MSFVGFFKLKKEIMVVVVVASYEEETIGITYFLGAITTHHTIKVVIFIVTSSFPNI